jgi:hypothetical protein
MNQDKRRGYLLRFATYQNHTTQEPSDILETSGNLASQSQSQDKRSPCVSPAQNDLSATEHQRKKWGAQRVRRLLVGRFGRRLSVGPDAGQKEEIVDYLSTRI